MRRIIGLFIVVLLLFAAVESTTFGWSFFGRSIKKLKPKDSFISERLKNHVYKISHEIGRRSIIDYDNLEKTAGYITGQFESYGYSVEFQEFIVDSKKVKNIIAIKKGERVPEEIIIVAAHYDSYSIAGANDNASGVAGILELARFMSDKLVSRTVKFISFVNEEPPYFKTEKMGSMVYAKSAKERNEPINSVIILDMIGYYSDKAFSQRYPIPLGFFAPNRADFISIVSNFKSNRSLRKIRKIFKRSSKFPIVTMVTKLFLEVDFSDNWSFWQEGFPAVVVSDTAYYRAKDYHTEHDTWEKLDYNSMGCVVEGFSSVVAELAQDRVLKRVANQ